MHVQSIKFHKWTLPNSLGSTHLAIDSSRLIDNVFTAFDLASSSQMYKHICQLIDSIFDLGLSAPMLTLKNSLQSSYAWVLGYVLQVSRILGQRS